MKFKLSTESKNILQKLFLVAIGLICDAFIFSIISTLYIPEVGWGTYNYTTIELMYRKIFYKYMYQHISIISFVVSCSCLLLFKIFLFPKMIFAIENTTEKTKISVIIKNIHICKNSVLYIFIVFCLLSFLFLNGYADIYNLSNKIAYFFVIPLHYLAIYLYWQYNDTKNLKQEKTDGYIKKDAYIELIKYVLITNPFFIILSLFSMFIILLKLFPLFENFIIFIFLSLILLLILFYIFIVIKLLINSIKFVIKSMLKKSR